MKTLEIQTLSLQKEVSIQLNHPSNKAKLANLARRLEALETTEPSPVNQVSPNQFPNLACTYCQAINHVFKECHVFQAQQHFAELLNALFKAEQ